MKKLAPYSESGMYDGEVFVKTRAALEKEDGND